MRLNVMIDDTYMYVKVKEIHIIDKIELLE